MKTNILGTTPIQHQKMLSFRILLCIATAGMTALINIILVCLRSNATHTLFLMINIALDVASGFFLIYFIQEKILPQRRLYQLFCSNSTHIEGTITDILLEHQCYRKIDCQLICLGERRLFLPADTITLQVGEHISARVAFNVILEVMR